MREGLDWTERQPPPWVVVGAAAFGAAVLAAIHVWSTHGAVPVDLEVYRRGGDAVLSGVDRLYTGAPGRLPFTYPPLAAILFVPLALAPDVLATFTVALASYLSLALILWATLRHLPTARQMLLRHRPALAGLMLAGLVLVAALAEPVAETVRFGQVNLVLAALVMADLLLLRGRATGYLLAIAICIKVTPAIFLLVPLARRDWAMLRRATTTAGLLTLLPAFLVPGSWRAFWTQALWDPDRVGGLEFLSNQSLTGAVTRALGQDGSPILIRLLQLVILGIVAVTLWRTRGRDALPTVLLVALAGLLVSPISWIHHWVWVVPLVVWLGVRGLTPTGTGDRPRSPLGWAQLALAGAWLAVTLSRVMWLTPSDDGREYTASLGLKIIADAYTILGLVSLVLVAVSLRKPRRR